MIKNIPKIYWLLLMVAIIGSVNVFYSYGMVAGGGDESLVINSVLKFFRDFSLADKYETFLPGVIILYIPFIAIVLAAYLFLGLGNIGQLKELVIVDTYKFTPYFRLITVIFGIITVYLFYRICLEVFKKEKISLIASYLLATSLLFVQQIHLAGAWIVQTMMILISVYYSLLLLKKQNWHIWDFMISALLIVLSVEIETVGLIAIVPFFLVCWQRRKDMKVSQWIINLSLFFLLIILGLIFFVYLNPVTFHLYSSAFNGAAQSGIKVTYYGRNIWERFLDPLWIMILVEPLLFALFFLGMFTAFKKNKFIFGFFGFYVLFYYLAIGPILGGAIDRRLFPMIPALAVFAALFIDLLPKKIAYAALLFFLINPLIFDAALLKKGSIIEARKWINENIPADFSILDKCRLELNENKEVLNEIEKSYPSFLTTKEKYLLNKPVLLADRKGYFVIEDFVIGDTDIIKTLKAKKFQYLTVCYLNDMEKIETMKFFQNIEKIKIYDSAADHKNNIAIDPFLFVDFSRHLEKLALLNLFNVPYYGPNVEIYALFFKK